MNVKLSEDLTLVLIRANGAPRTFNLPVPRLKRNIFLVAGIFAILLICSLVFSSLYVYDNFIAEKPPLLTDADAEKLQSIDGLQVEIGNLQKKLLTRNKTGGSCKDHDEIVYLIVENVQKVHDVEPIVRLVELMVSRWRSACGSSHRSRCASRREN